MNSLMQLAFAYRQGDPLPPVQLVTLDHVDSITGLPVTTAMSAQLASTLPSWLRLNRFTGSLPLDLDVTVDPSALAVGAYAAQVLVLSTSVPITNAPAGFDVSLTVSDAGSGGGSMISNVSAASGKAYVQATLASGALLYIDRAYVFGTVPAPLAAQAFIRTANDDKGIAVTVPALSFTLDQDADVYVLYTNVASTMETAWLTAANGWVTDSFTVPSNLNGAEANRLVKHKSFVRGPVTLNGAGATSSMYNIVAVPKTAPVPTPTPPTHNIQVLIDGVSVYQGTF